MLCTQTDHVRTIYFIAVTLCAFCNKFPNVIVHFDVSFNMTPKNMHDVTSPLPINNDRNKMATKVYVSGKELLEIHKKWFNIKTPWQAI